MKKIILLSGLICILCTACSKDNFDKELLFGTWKLQSSAYPVFSPTVSFDKNGDYTMVELIKNPFYFTIIDVGKVTGKYLIYDNKIEFSTATVIMAVDTTVNSSELVSGVSFVYYYNRWTYDSIVHYTNSGNPPIIARYNPVTWTIIELTESTLKVLKSPCDTLVYLKD